MEKLLKKTSSKAEDWSDRASTESEDDDKEIVPDTKPLSIKGRQKPFKQDLELMKFKNRHMYVGNRFVSFLIKYLHIFCKAFL